jgi:phage baseplate assembly protein W
MWELEPKSLEEEVHQNIRFLLDTQKGSVPLNREFGISLDLLDNPTPAAKQKLIAEIITAIEKWEPRAKVTNVSFEETPQGKLKPQVKFVIISGGQ